MSPGRFVVGAVVSPLAPPRFFLMLDHCLDDRNTKRVQLCPVFFNTMLGSKKIQQEGGKNAHLVTGGVESLFHTRPEALGGCVS
jgi:hypothetical protein